MSAYSPWPEDDSELWESLQLSDFPVQDAGTPALSVDSTVSLTTRLLGAKQAGEVISVHTVDQRTWSIRLAAIGTTWFSGETTHPRRGVLISLHAVVRVETFSNTVTDTAPVGAPLSRALAVTAATSRWVRASVPGARDTGELVGIASDHVSIRRRGLDGHSTLHQVPFGQLIAIEFVEPGDIS